MVVKCIRIRVHLLRVDFSHENAVSSMTGVVVVFDEKTLDMSVTALGSNRRE